LIYLWVVGSYDVESQRRGLVLISLSGPKVTDGIIQSQSQDKKVKEKEDSDSQEAQKFHASRMATHVLCASSVPFRVSAIHLCLPQKPMYKILKSIYGVAIGSRWNSRVKFHLGESIELRYELQQYGTFYYYNSLTLIRYAFAYYVAY
jgi:hypothetical protein